MPILSTNVTPPRSLELPEPMRAEIEAEQAHVRVALDAPPTTFALRRLPLLTAETADLVITGGNEERPVLVLYAKSSPDGRKRLRDARVSFAGDDGRIFLYAPPLYVERELPRRPRAETPDLVAVESGGGEDVGRNPFSERSSRIPRWLLLHPGEPFTVTLLAAAVDLSVAAVSRVVRSLDDAGFLERGETLDGRTREFRLRRPRDLLQTWAARRMGKQTRQRLWDVGAADVEAAFALLGGIGREFPTLKWSVGGLAGAAVLRRSVEPADVALWVRPDQVGDLAHTLMPEPGRPSSRGVLRIRTTPDPWVLDLATSHDGLRIADPVQLWLDCMNEGERALEAADAVAQTVGW